MRLNKARRGAYKFGRFLGDVNAIERSIETDSPAPAAKRVARKVAYRKTNKGLRAFLKALGLM